MTTPDDTHAASFTRSLPLSRRQLVTGGLGLWLSQRLGPGIAVAQEAEPQSASADACIVLWMNGGPSHLETFDPKRGKVAGPFQSIATRQQGVRFGQYLPQLAERADQLAVIRGMTSKEGNHQRARYLLHTGYAPSPTVRHPSIGAWLSKTRPGGGELPSFISVAGPSVGAGFLGADHKPFVLRRPGVLPDNVGYGFGVDAERFERRRAMLARANARFGTSRDAAARSNVQRRAQRMMHADELSAFDLDEEPAKLREAYGDSDFGRGCLLARRLVERGVRVVEVTLGGWDTHRDNFERSKRLMGVLDPAMSTLLADLQQRGRLGRTLVVWMGEFGRTPRINDNEGRDHYPKAWSAVLAGGGIRAGIAHGATDDQGATVVRDPVTVPNLMATICQRMGVAPDHTERSPGGRPIAVTESGSVVRALLADG
jgi:uncharacterized protein (DUF1501 family)